MCSYSKWCLSLDIIPCLVENLNRTKLSVISYSNLHLIKSDMLCSFCRMLCSPQILCSYVIMPNCIWYAIYQGGKTAYDVTFHKLFIFQIAFKPSCWKEVRVFTVCIHNCYCHVAKMSIKSFIYTDVFVIVKFIVCFSYKAWWS